MYCISINYAQLVEFHANSLPVNNLLLNFFKKLAEGHNRLKTILAGAFGDLPIDILFGHYSKRSRFTVQS
jgi:hypothetical protein